MFGYIRRIDLLYRDYQHLLTHQEIVLDSQTGKFIPQQHHILDQTIPRVEYGPESSIEIEIRSFPNIGCTKEVDEYCKPFSFEHSVADSDDVCKVAVVVIRKLMDDESLEFGLQMLQLISDFKDYLEETGGNQEEGGFMTFKEQKQVLDLKLD